MDNSNELIPHLFRTEYSKITAVLCRVMGMAHIGAAEDIASDTFLQAAETWAMKGVPENPAAWLYTVAKNKAKDYLKRAGIFANKIAAEITHTTETQHTAEPDIDLSGENIRDSQLQMMFAICHPCITAEAQVSLALNVLCGFGAEEIAAAFLTNKETVYKRLARAKEKLKANNIQVALPPAPEINARLEMVLTTLYLLFNEGCYSTIADATLRKDLCLEAMRLNYLLIENAHTCKPFVHALMALMCFHASRLEARLSDEGTILLYDEQDTALWNNELIEQGKHHLAEAAKGEELTRYHLEAAIAYWHTRQEDTQEKWENILQLYNRLLQLHYSPIAALNRTYALGKANGAQEAIAEAEKLKLTGNYLYYSLLGHLYTGIDNVQAIKHLKTALGMAKPTAAKTLLQQKINTLTDGIQRATGRTHTHSAGQ